MILTKVGEHVNEMMAVAAHLFLNFRWSGFLIIRQNVNMAINAILYCGLTPKDTAHVCLDTSFYKCTSVLYLIRWGVIQRTH